ncbi:MULTISPECIES: hypothetical protein [Leucobacter]|uniref:Cyclic lactone autoinducer peptide n=1 Tax=Leucobacter manosquensis TaxID=2810611 RepID=A0ABS5M2H3_9MICO|nr:MULTISPECIES: hypothetical protein [Leucobacter]MBS3181160.1 hypothetical protein [Leucobacter manosquensis]
MNVKRLFSVLIAIGMVVAAAYVALVIHADTTCHLPEKFCVEEVAWLD